MDLVTSGSGCRQIHLAAAGAAPGKDRALVLAARAAALLPDHMAAQVNRFRSQGARRARPSHTTPHAPRDRRADASVMSGTRSRMQEIVRGFAGAGWRAVASAGDEDRETAVQTWKR